MTRVLVYSPDGWLIQGTAEELPAIGEVHFQLNDDELEWDFTGSTDVRWDGQQTLKQNGDPLFVDMAGNKYPEHELVVNPTKVGVRVVDQNDEIHFREYDFSDIAGNVKNANRRDIQEHAREDLGLEQPDNPFNDPQDGRWHIVLVSQNDESE